MEHYPETDEDTDDASSRGADRGSPPATPRWVIVLGIIAVALVVVFVVAMLLGGHRPPVQHMP